MRLARGLLELQGSLLVRLAAYLAVIGCGAGMGVAAAADVTIGVVVMDVRGERPLDAVQDAWRSPIGGWVVATAPFGVKIANKPIFEFRTAAETIAAESGMTAGDAEELVKKVDGDEYEGGRPSADAKTFRFDRPASSIVAVGEGKRSVTPSASRSRSLKTVCGRRTTRGCESMPRGGESTSSVIPRRIERGILVRERALRVEARGLVLGGKPEPEDRYEL